MKTSRSGISSYPIRGVLGASLLLFGAGCPKARPVAPFATPDDFTEERLNAVVREIVPLVEEAAGAEFQTVPFVRLGRPSDLKRIIQDEAEEALSILYPEVPDWLLDGVVRQARGTGVAGKYALYDKILLVSPEAMVMTAALLPDDPQALDKVTRLVLAHELTHALQDQVADGSARFEDRPHYDAFEALRAVTEGHANFVERRVAERLGWLDAVKALNGSQGWSDAGPESAYAWPVWALYGQGAEFVSWHFAVGGLDRTWMLLRDPPTRSRTPFVPEEYGSERGSDASWAEKLDGFERTLLDGRALASSGPVPEKELRQRLWGVPSEALEPWLARIEDGGFRTASKSQRSVVAFWLHLDDAGPEAGISLLRDHEGAIQVAYQPDRRSLGFDVDVEERDPAGFDAGYSVEMRMVEEVEGGDARTVAGEETHALWAVAGNDLVIVEVTGFRPGTRLDAALALLAERR